VASKVYRYFWSLVFLGWKFNIRERLGPYW